MQLTRKTAPRVHFDMNNKFTEKRKYTLFIFKPVFLQKFDKMILEKRIESLVKLGEVLREFPENADDKCMSLLLAASRIAESENPWFTSDNIKTALVAIGETLLPSKIEKWLAPYKINLSEQRLPGEVAVVMAGNIPAVGFHDFLSVLISGHRIIAKLSSQDQRLLPAMAEILLGFNREWKYQINFTLGKLPYFQAIVVTGNNTTFRYFEYYFRNHPHLIRHNRNSISILNGSETRAQLAGLADDIMMYFGLGCRNVSKLFVPRNYDFTGLIAALESFRKQCDHSKYWNNYEYHKSIFLINKTSFHDTGFLLLIPSQNIYSQIGVVNFEEYTDIQQLASSIQQQKEFIQCIVYAGKPLLNSIQPGTSQHPELWDYADDIDTMAFLQHCNFN